MYIMTSTITINAGPKALNLLCALVLRIRYTSNPESKRISLLHYILQGQEVKKASYKLLFQQTLLQTLFLFSAGHFCTATCLTTWKVRAGLVKTAKFGPCVFDSLQPSCIQMFNIFQLRMTSLGLNPNFLSEHGTSFTQCHRQKMWSETPRQLWLGV